jgi:hypothetical protein
VHEAVSARRGHLALEASLLPILPGKQVVDHDATLVPLRKDSSAGAQYS